MLINEAQFRLENFSRCCIPPATCFHHKAPTRIQNASLPITSQLSYSGSSPLVLKSITIRIYKVLFSVVQDKKKNSSVLSIFQFWYKALIHADCVTLTDETLNRIKRFIANGGAVLFTGKSALRDGRFLLDAGTEYLGEGEYKQDYSVSTENLQLPYGNAPVICYESAQRTHVTNGKILEKIREPRFDRTYAHFSDHLNTPFRNTEAEHPACVRKSSVIYMAHPLCRMYFNSGMPLFREMLIRALKLIYTPKCRITLPTESRCHLIRQTDESRYVLHTAYARPVRRGRVEMVEDIVPIYNIPVEIDLSETITAVTLQPQNVSIPFVQENGTLRFNIPKIFSNQAAEIEYERV